MLSRRAVASSLFFGAGAVGAAGLSVVDVAASVHILMLLSDGTVVGMGENRSGQIGGAPSIHTLNPPRRIALPAKAVQVSAWGDTSYALLDNGTVWAWGRGYAGELGVKLSGGTFRAAPAEVPGLRGVKKVVAGGESAMALLEDGTVRAWGKVPPLVAETKMPGVANAIGIAGSVWRGYAITKDARLIGWDLTDHPDLRPDGSKQQPMPPTEIAVLRDVVSVANHEITSAAVTKDGRVWTWGHNAQGGLGNGLRASGPGDPSDETPKPVNGIANAVAVKAGAAGRHFIALRKDGTLIGWGNDDWGQLGSGRREPGFQLTPAPVKLAGVEAYWLGGNFSFARTKDGKLWFWGERDGARVLLGQKSPHQRVPAQVPLEAILGAAAQ